MYKESDPRGGKDELSPTYYFIVIAFFFLLLIFYIFSDFIFI